MLEIAKYVYDIKSTLEGYHVVAHEGNVRDTQLIRWMPPPSRWFKVKLDGGFIRESGMASTGEVLCDEARVWHDRFAINIGFCSIIAGELWGLFKGLKLAWRRDARM